MQHLPLSHVPRRVQSLYLSGTTEASGLAVAILVAILAASAGLGVILPQLHHRILGRQSDGRHPGEDANPWEALRPVELPRAVMTSKLNMNGLWSILKSQHVPSNMNCGNLAAHCNISLQSYEQPCCQGA
jgi:hypothetical protein